MIFNETEKQERDYLQQIITLLNKTINRTQLSVKDHVDTLAAHKDYLWSNKDIDPHEIRSMRESILNHLAIGESVINKGKQLAKILEIPYFGRIDFREEQKNNIALPVYIGIHSFYHPESKINLIFDWRAPVAGMFYDYETGEASYMSPGGEVKGNITLKRQYRIRNGKMEFMIESSLTVHDDILQKELSSHTDIKMKNIVTTIQREQNKIIRNEVAQTLIIQGVAGSGKTSVALHRIAYLLYIFKENLSSKDLLIISPNKVFADYISNVLPELGEETIPETGMEQILSGIMENKYKFRNFFEQVNEILTKPSPDLIERIKYKSTTDFVSQLDRFIVYIENTYFKAYDVKLTRYITIPGRYIQQQFKRFNRNPMRQRFEIMTDYILQMAQIQYHITITRAEHNILKKEIKKMFAGNNDLEVYKNFFEWTGKPEMLRLSKNRTLEYCDLAPLAYLHIALEGNKIRHTVKHLLIDEMQDYTPIQYKVIQKLFPCRKTILGDSSQSVNPYGSSTAEMIQKVLTGGEVMRLCKSYRSTYEITSFAQNIQKNEELIPVERHGEKPEILWFKSIEDETEGIIRLISSFRKSVYKSCAVICKTELQAQEMADKLRFHIPDLYLLSHQSTAFVQGIIITCAHVAKGLEFDEVIIPQSNKENYSTEIDKSMLYIAVTRAMHRLTCTSSNHRGHRGAQS